MTDKPFRYAGYFGLAMSIIAAIIMVGSPPPSTQEGAHSSQIVDFEFVDSPDELKSFLGRLCEGSTEGLSDKEHCDLRKKQINFVNYLDFPMMICYGLFLFFLTSQLAKETGEAVLERAKYLAPLAVIFDALENAQMLIMTRDTFDGADHVFLCLSLFARLKWGVLVALIAVIGYGMRKMDKSKWLGYLLSLPLLAGTAALITDGHLSIEAWTGLTFLAIFILLLFCFIYKSKKSASF